MSDNPSGDDLIRLGVDTDQGSFSEFDSAVKGVQASIEELTSMLQGVTDAQAAWNEQVQEAIKVGTERDLQREIDQEVALASAVEAAAEAERTATEALERRYEAAVRLSQIDQRGGITPFNPNQGYFAPGQDLDVAARGYGVSGGMIGPGEAGDEDNSIGSTYGVSRAFSSSGALARRFGANDLGAGLTEGGEFLRVAQGFGRISDILPALNASIEAAPGLLAPLVSGFTALGIPMAGLVAVALPLIGAVAGVALAIKGFNETMAESKRVVEGALASHHLYLQTLEAGTTSTINKELELQRIKAQTADEEVRRLEQQKRSAESQQAFNLGGDGSVEGKIFDAIMNPIANAAKGASGDMQALNKQLDEAKKASADAHNAIDGLNQSLPTMSVLINDLSEKTNKFIDATANKFSSIGEQVNTAALKGINDNTKIQTEAEQFIATGTPKSVQARLDAIAQEGAIAQASLPALKERAQYDQNALAQYNATKEAIANLTKEQDVLINQVMPLVQAHQAYTDALAAEQKILQERGNFFNEVGKLRATGTEQGYDSMVGGLQGKKEGDLSEIANLEAQNSLTDDQQKRLEFLKKQIVEIDNQLEFLSRDVKLWIDAREAEGAITKADAALAKETAAAEKQAKAATAENIRREAQAEAELSRGSLQDTEARYQIATKESRDELKIRQDTADKILDIATKVGQQEDDAHKTLARKQEDDLTKFYNDRAKLERDANTQASEDAVEHAQRVREIQRQSHSDETSALLNRDFLSLMKSRQKDQDNLSKEDQSYNAREQKLSRHLQQQESELQIRLQQEDAQARVAFNRKIEDIVQNANREIEQQHVAEQRKIQQAEQSQRQALEDLAHTEDYKIRLLRHNQAIELQLIADQERQRLAIANATNVAIVNAANRTIDQIAQHQPGAAEAARGSGAQRSRYAGGGVFGAGDSFEMGEFGSETLNIGRDSYTIPGQAIVYPLQTGSVSPSGSNSKSINFAPVINIDGRGKSDSELADMLTDRMVTLIEHIMPVES